MEPECKDMVFAFHTIIVRGISFLYKKVLSTLNMKGKNINSM